MYVNCSKENLIANINISLKAVSTKTTLPILECILLIANDKGFRLISNNLELGIETRNIESEIIEKGCVALEAKIFSDIIKSLPEEAVSIEVSNNNTTIIKSGKSEFKISGQKGEEFPLLPEIEKSTKIKINSINLKNMIRQTIFSVAQDETKPILTGELIEIKNEDFNIVAIDGFRVSFRKTNIENVYKDINVVVPSKTLNEISKILSDKNNDNEKINIYFSDKHILFEINDCTIISRLLEGEFLKYEQIFTDEYTTQIEVNRLFFIQGLERATLVSKEIKKNPVKLNIESNKLTITSNADFGTSYEEINIETEGENLEIAFNPKYLIDALKSIENDEIFIQFTSPLSPCIIKDIRDNNYKYLILPLKLKNND